jgi:hypothetical protein
MRRREPLAWVGAIAVAALPVPLAPALSGALDGRSAPVVAIAAVAGWTAWGVTLLAALVPTTVSLTILRLLTPAAPLAAVGSALAGAPSLAAAGGAALGAIAAVVAHSAEVGHRYVQGSAYGDETRFGLRPPGALLLLLPVGWLAGAAALVGGVGLISADRWLSGLPVAGLGAAWATLFGLRCHRLSRRFLVFVPAGFVIHDHLVLSDTALFLRAQVAGFGLARAGTGAADLTGGALGNAVEFRLVEPGTVVLNDRSRPGGRAIHLSAGLVAPSRPGRVLAEARRRGLAVDA